MADLDLIKTALMDEGYSGLYYDGECAGGVDDFAPCGECQVEEGELGINGCEPGYKFLDPSNPDLWVVKGSNKPPTEEEWMVWRE